MRPSTQNSNNGGNGGMQFDPNNWGSGYTAMTENSIMQRPYAIQKFSNHPDDPYVATGIIPTQTSLGNEQAPYTSNPQNQQQDGYPKTNIQQSAAQATDYVDSGYGGSHLSYSVSSPSVRTGKTEDVLNLKCMKCDYEAKNNSELRKHINRHKKPHKCDIRNCTKGFATQNDLDRHKRTVHRKEFYDKGTTVLYECIHCKDQLGKSNTRKKIEWPRKDNFLAHLDRVHHIRLRPSDNLDHYMSRGQQNPKVLMDTISGATGQAQHLALQGVGTGAHTDISGPHSRIAFADELAPGDQANNVFQEQRFSMFIHRNSHVLANASVLAPSTQQEFISPVMLNSHEHNLGANLHIANGDGLQQPHTDPPRSVPHATGGHRFNDDVPHGGHVHVESRSHGHISDIDETNEYVSENPPVSGSTGNTTMAASQPQLEPTTPPLYTNSSLVSALSPSGILQSSSSPLTASEDILRLLRQIPRETLQAALDNRTPDSEEGGATETETALKRSHLCPTCQKSFKRQCELTKHKKRHSKPYFCTWRDCSKSFGSKNDWKRHESKQHYNIESWVCDVEDCKKEWNRRETFKMHLKNAHFICPEDIDSRVDQCRQGKHCNAYFWCGFCVQRIDVDLNDGNGNAWTKRFDHVDAHFCGRGAYSQQSIEEWKHETQTPVAAPDSSHGSPHPGITMSQTVSSASASQKRPADPMFSEVPRRKRKRNKWAEMWQCCECAMFMNLRTSSACVSCGRYRCHECPITKELLPDEDAPETGQDEQQRQDSQYLSLCAG
ncbi:hypothetical protein C2857_002727 [Epichloe festucae Fl1]|uniref:C2H2-type domain-containing protein n=1 Tax=Epichloe festucae (strain Fl1) TaxID=877507 RepID=A0A7S9KUL5_EPIFF|nr:hypothetical protein C2857_002727 [Epichloe festucae Fl1]